MIRAVMKTRNALGATAILAILAACSSDPQPDDTFSALRQVASGLGAKVIPGRAAKSAAPVRSADDIARAALAANPAPLVLATLQATQSSQAMAMVAQNGGKRTYASPNKQALILQDGILLATRGLGHDLNAAKIDQVAPLIHSRRNGDARRVNYILSGEGKEIALSLDCSVTTGADKAFDFAGRSWKARQVQESCTGKGVSFSNSYLVDASGRIILSNQWIGPGLGHMTIQTIRP